MTPTPTQIRAARESAGLSQEAAAALIYKTRSAWAQWEARESASNHRAMDRVDWEMFLLKARHPELWEMFLLKNQKSPE